MRTRLHWSTRRISAALTIGLVSLAASGTAPNDDARWIAGERTNDSHRWTSSTWRVEASGQAPSNRDVALLGPVRAVSDTTHVLAESGAFRDGQLVLSVATVSADDWQLQAARVLITADEDRLVLDPVSTKRSRPSTDATRE